MSSDLVIDVQEREGVTVIAMTGDVTASTGQMVEDAHRKASDKGVKKFILAFNGENYINSGGIAFLIGIAADSKGRDQVVRISGLSDHFRKIFDMMGLTRYMEIYPTLEGALDGF